MSYKIHCYGILYNQVRNLGEISLDFLPRIDDIIILATDNTCYDGKVKGQIISTEIDTTKDNKITCYLGQVINV